MWWPAGVSKKLGQRIKSYRWLRFVHGSVFVVLLCCLAQTKNIIPVHVILWNVRGGTLHTYVPTGFPGRMRWPLGYPCTYTDVGDISGNFCNVPYCGYYWLGTMVFQIRMEDDSCPPYPGIFATGIYYLNGIEGPSTHFLLFLYLLIHTESYPPKPASTHTLSLRLLEDILTSVCSPPGRACLHSSHKRPRPNELSKMPRTLVPITSLGWDRCPGHPPIPSNRERATLVTLGSEGKITVQAPGVEEIQCSFEWNPRTEIVMFRDRFTGRTSHVQGQFPFEPKRSQKVVVMRKLNAIFYFGKHGSYSFQIRWDFKQHDAKGNVNSYPEGPMPLGETHESWSSLGPGQRTKPLVPNQETIRHYELKRLGSGTFATAFKTVHVDTGAIVAVKRLDSWGNTPGMIQEEVEALDRLRHVSDTPSHIYECTG